MPRERIETVAPSRRDELLRRGLRFSQLRLLVALAETGRVSAAAAQLAMTQPAASRLLAELEKTAEATLYTRHARTDPTFFNVYEIWSDQPHLYVHYASDAWRHFARDSVEMLQVRWAWACVVT